VKLNFLDLPVFNGYETRSTRPPQRTSSVFSINFLLMSAIDRMRNQENERQKNTNSLARRHSAEDELAMRRCWQ